MGWRDDLRHGTDEWGITDGFHDIAGTWHPTSDAGRRALRTAMGEIESYPPLWVIRHGDHHDLWNECCLVLEDGSGRGAARSLPDDLPLGYHDLVPLDGGPTTRLIVTPRRCRPIPVAWGLAIQIYALHSAGSQGIGDLADLATIMRWLLAHGGGAVLVNPLHAPQLSPHVQNSPYYPTSRRRRDPLCLRVDDVEPFHRALIDRDAVWAAKEPALRRQFVASQSESTFDTWLESQIDEQLRACRAAAPGVAMIGDLAVGFAPDGEDAADFSPALAPAYEIGSPPDAFNADGQRWGLAPFVPWRLRAAHYRPLIDTLRASLRGMDGLRIDHVMGLFRQFWLPRDGAPADGAYVRLPAEEVIGIVALEAERAGAFLIGEDLGTVEPAVREALDEYGIAGTNVLWFSDGSPEEWRTDCLATVTTHDLPTIAGVLAGTDGDGQMRRLLAGLSDGEPSAAAVHAALRRSPASLRLLTIDDLVGASERPNLPGTTDEMRPNWRIPLPVGVEDIVTTIVP